MTDLFDHAAQGGQKTLAPLAERLRPQKLSDILGQEKLLGPNGPLRRLLEADQIPSLILWGPPGSGKTTLAHVIAQHSQAKFHALSAVLSGVKELKVALEDAKNQWKFHGRKTLVFIDEIHRFNKAQQDALLPSLESGIITLIGATTENPSFEIISPLLSRSRVFVLEALPASELAHLIERGAQELGVAVSEEAREFLLQLAQGDARYLLNTLEIAAQLSSGQEVALSHMSQAAQKRPLPYDKDGEEHYNLISAFIKSMRASDPDAAVYYLARMYEAGEEPRFLARRMVIFAAEDVGLADPQALILAVAAFEAFECVGQAEGWIPLAEAAVYLARAPKSNASYMAYKHALVEIGSSGALPVPLHLRNAPTKLMKKLDYGKDYKYAHHDPEGSAAMRCLPEAIGDKKFLRS